MGDWVWASTSGILGVALFRHTQYHYVKYCYSHRHGTAIIELLNASGERGYKQLEVKAAAGVKITALEIVEGVSKESTITLSATGDLGRIQGVESATTPIVPPAGEGTLRVSYSGTPTDPKAPNLHSLRKAESGDPSCDRRTYL